MSRHRIDAPTHEEKPVDVVATVQMLAQAVVALTQRLAAQEAQIAKLAAKLALVTVASNGREA